MHGALVPGLTRRDAVDPREVLAERVSVDEARPLCQHLDGQSWVAFEQLPCGAQTEVEDQRPDALTVRQQPIQVAARDVQLGGDSLRCEPWVRVVLRDQQYCLDHEACRVSRRQSNTPLESP